MVVVNSQSVVTVFPASDDIAVATFVAASTDIVQLCTMVSVLAGTHNVVNR